MSERIGDDYAAGFLFITPLMFLQNCMRKAKEAGAPGREATGATPPLQYLSALLLLCSV